VKAQTSAYLDKSRELLDEANAILRIDLYEAAGRTAYLAGFHAAQALIFETSGRIYKNHSGVHGEFSRLVKDDPHVDDDLRAFLGRTYSLKAIADYETGPGSPSRPRARATQSRPLGDLSTSLPGFCRKGNGPLRDLFRLAQTSNSIREGCSTHSLIRTRKVTASRPSTMRWS
jgi:uncharacterized protein (UPF0332 family)